jgi:sugar lactone lactonase YvrE
VFNNTGKKMYMIGIAQNTVFEYDLSTAYDVSTASYNSVNFSVVSQETNSRSLTFNDLGTKMYIIGATNDTIYQYSLSTAFDVSTASYDSVSFSISAQLTLPSKMVFLNSGKKMYILGRDSDSVFQYSLSTAYDVSTASYDSISFSVASQETDPNSLALNNSKDKMYIVGSNSDTVYQYSLGTTLELGTGSFASADVGKTIEANSGEFVLTATDGSYVEATAPTSYDQVASGDWSMYGVVYNAVDGDLELSSYSNGYALSSASYDSVFFSVASQSTTPLGLNFNPTGTRMFVVDIGTAYIYQYNLSESFNILTAVYTTSFLLSSQTTQPIGVAFNSDGTKMFIASYNTSILYQYTLSTGFDVSTASYDSVSLNVSAQQTNPRDLRFNSDGTKMFVVGGIAQAVSEYSLSTAFLLSTATFVDSFSVSSQSSAPVGLTFNTDGTKMFTVDQSSTIVDAYNLSVGFDVSTASYLNSFSASSVDNNANGIVFNANGSKMFLVGATYDAIYQYSTASSYFPTGYQPVHTTASTDTTYWTDINSMTADQAAGDGNVYYAISTDDRTTWTVIDNTDGERDIVRNNGGTWQYNSNGTYASETWVNGTTNTELATLAEAMEGAAVGYGLVNASYDSVSFSIAAQETTPQGITFNPSGTKMFSIGSASKDVDEYALSIAFDVSTAVFTQGFNVSAQTLSPSDVVFSTDGTKMYLSDAFNSGILQYALSTGFDVSTASYTQNFATTATGENDPRAVAFNTDGTTMFIVGVQSDSVIEYALSTAYDISTASLVDSFSVSAQDINPNGLTFNADGTQMFIVGYTSNAVFKYTLSTGFDVSTASYSGVSFSLASQETLATGIAFSADGSKMFIVGTQNDSVYRYTTASYTNQMDKTQLDAVTDPNHIALGNDLDLAIVFNMTSGTTVPSSDGVAINYDATVLNKGAVLGTDYDFDAPAQDKVRITALAGNNLKVRVV